MGAISTYRDLAVWRKGLELAQAVYSLTQSFPTAELYGLTGQMRRAAVSVPSNIAEGQARRGPKEFARFLYHARGGLAELDTQITLSRRLEYITTEKAENVFRRIDELQRMLYVLIDKLGERK